MNISSSHFSWLPFVGNADAILKRLEKILVMLALKLGLNRPFRLSLLLTKQGLVDFILI
jgi:hypothetical protein